MTEREHLEQAGFTVMELMVAVSILAVVLLTVLGSLASFTDRTRQTENRALMLSETRTAVERITRDLRAANPIVALDPSVNVSLYNSEVSFSVYCASAGVGNCGTDNLRPVTYRVSSNQLLQITAGSTRTLLGPQGNTALAVTSRQGAIVNTSTQPVFQYFKKDGTQLDTDDSDGGAATSAKIRDCAQYVEIHLVVVAEPGKPQNTINLVTRADLRNFNQVTAC